MSSRKELYDAIQNKNWTEAQTLLNSPTAKDLVEYSDRYGNALFIACNTSDVPHSLLLDMLSKSQTAPMTQGYNKRTPVHCAMDISTDETILTLIDACPRAVSISDIWNATPLAWAVGFNRSTEIFTRLIEAYPEAVTLKDDFGKTPLRKFTEAWDDGLRVKLASSRRRCGTSFMFKTLVIRGDSLRKRMKAKMGEVYEKAMLLLRAAAAVRNRRSGTTFRPLMEAIRFPECSWSFLILVLKTDLRLASEADEVGNLPIHVVAATESSFDKTMHACQRCFFYPNKEWYQHTRRLDVVFCRECFAKPWSKQKDKEDCCLIRSVDKITECLKTLLEINPQFPSLPDPAGRLPFCIAVANGKSFNEEIVQILFRAAPDALSTRDMPTHLYPFVLPAIGEANDCRTRSDNKEKKPSDKYLEKFSCCFAMLMENPVLVSSGIVVTRRSKRKRR